MRDLGIQENCHRESSMAPEPAVLRALPASSVLFLVVGIGGLIFAASTDWTIPIDCIALARSVAARNYSILDGEPFRKVQRQAYRTCLGDPVAFARLMRRGST